MNPANDSSTRKAVDLGACGGCGIWEADASCVLSRGGWPKRSALKKAFLYVQPSVSLLPWAGRSRPGRAIRQACRQTKGQREAVCPSPGGGSSMIEELLTERFDSSAEEHNSNEFIPRIS